MFSRTPKAKGPEEMVRQADEYRIGNTVEQSFTTAFSLYRKAASKGYARAQSLLGTMYESGHGIQQSYREAAKWYEKAAENDDLDGMCSLAFLYESGLGVKRSRFKYSL